MFRTLTFLLCLAPLISLVGDLLFLRSGPDPTRHIMQHTGNSTFMLLLLVLTISFFRKVPDLKFIFHLRRQIGLFVFFYASLHTISYLLLYMDFGWIHVKSEILKRPYIVFGFMCWLLLLPLALTSNRYFQRLLGESWIKLHKLIYIASIFACVHVWLQVRSDATSAVSFSIIVAGLLGWRIHRSRSIYRILSVSKK